jgi:hypothetical protein
MTLQQQLKAVKQQILQQTERNQELQTKYEDLEKALEVAKQQRASIVAVTTRDQLASQQDKHAIKEDMKIQTDGIWDMSNTLTKEKMRTPTPNNVSSSTSNINPSSFSINNLLSLETPKQDNKHTVHMVVPKLENGHEGGDPAGTMISPPPLEPSDSQPLPVKGIADGIGTEVNAFNVETVN